MKHIMFFVTLVCVLPLSAAELLLEAESFDSPGGWVVDGQFVETMGSPYLLAHGLGRPVQNAQTQVVFPASGEYRVWVRTKDWAPPHGPGRFRLLVDGQKLEREFGAQGRRWGWRDGGLVDLQDTDVTVELADLTGFDGRVDAIYFTTDQDARPTGDSSEQTAAWRRKLLGLPEIPPETQRFGVVVVGGGVAGCSAALAAARLGVDVALIQDRPVLGGNSSSDINIHPVGMGRSIVDEIAPPHKPDVAFGDQLQLAAKSRLEVLQAEEKIQLFVGWRAFRANTLEKRITCVDAKNVTTGEELRFVARSFIDCTGDGWIGYWAGADFRTGREGRQEFDESLAPDEPDAMTHGLTLYFKIAVADQPAPFPQVPWAREVAGDHLDLKSDHSWEYGHWRDMIGEAEEIRDHLLRGIYGTFANAKVKYAQKAAKVELTYVGYIAARGESRRLVGDHVLSQNDITSRRDFPDAVATGSVVFCLHTPRDEPDFRSDLKLTPVKPYGIPFRCLYARDVENLMMAGRCVSATHVGFSSIKLMKTGGQMGVAVGAAAMLCEKYDTTPRGLYEEHLQELRDVVFERGTYEGALAAP